MTALSGKKNPTNYLQISEFDLSENCYLAWFLPGVSQCQYKIPSEHTSQLYCMNNITTIPRTSLKFWFSQISLLSNL